jgi:hypothetical protein
MKNETQISWVKKQIEEQGFISRNQCLRNYISRLGAIIADLKAEGYQFEAGYEKTEHGKDYVYTFVGMQEKEQNALFKMLTFK